MKKFLLLPIITALMASPLTAWGDVSVLRNAETQSQCEDFYGGRWNEYGYDDDHFCEVTPTSCTEHGGKWAEAYLESTDRVEMSCLTPSSCSSATSGSGRWNNGVCEDGTRNVSAEANPTVGNQSGVGMLQLVIVCCLQRHVMVYMHILAFIIG